jgi:hypothetical protein
MNNLWEYAKWTFYGGWAVVTIAHYIINDELYQLEAGDEEIAYMENEFPFDRRSRERIGTFMNLFTLHWDILESDPLKLKNKKRNANLWSLIFIFYTILVPFVWCFLHAAHG